MIFGLDVSTSVCGWCMLHDDGRLHSVGHYDFNKKDDLYTRLYRLRLFIRDNFDFEAITTIFIEEPVKMHALSTAHTVALLQRWNGMVCAMLAFYFVEPIPIAAATARKTVGVDMKKHSGVSGKQLVMDHIQHTNALPSSIWKYKKTGRLKDYCYDMADAYVVAKAGFLNAACRVS